MEREEERLGSERERERERRERRGVRLGLKRCGLARPGEWRREVTWVEPY